MALDTYSKRHIKRKTIYSPSDPILPDYYLIYIEKYDEDFIVKRSSIKQQSNGKVLISIGGMDKEGEVITSGTKSHCEAEYNFRKNEANKDDMNDSDESDPPIYLLSSSSSSSKKKIRSCTNTPQPSRAKHDIRTTDNRSSSNNHDYDNDIYRSRSDIELFHKSPSACRKNDTKTNDDSESEDDKKNVEDLDKINRMIDTRVDGTMKSVLVSLNKKLNVVTKKLNQFYNSSSFGESQLRLYRNENDTFSDKVMHNDENLLDINGKNPGDYGRRLLRVLYSTEELKTSMLPSTVGNRYSKPKLDPKRFELLNSAMRNKYRIGKQNYADFYRNLVRKKLSDFLIEEERRDTKASKYSRKQPNTMDTSTPTTLTTTPTLPNDALIFPINDDK